VVAAGGVAEPVWLGWVTAQRGCCGAVRSFVRYGPGRMAGSGVDGAQRPSSVYPESVFCAWAWRSVGAGVATWSRPHSVERESEIKFNFSGSFGKNSPTVRVWKGVITGPPALGPKCKVP